MKANRETIVLIAAAGAMTFVLSRHAATTPAAVDKPVVAAPQEQVWTGQLAQVTPAASTAPVEPMSSAMLVVPKSALALPATPRKPPVKTAVQVPLGRTQVAGNTQLAALSSTQTGASHGLLHDLNPINHLPDMSSVRRPFAAAGETIAGWFRH